MYRLAYKNLFRRRGRTALAILGVAIGIAMIVGLVSISEGLKQRTDEFTAALGNNIQILEKDSFTPLFSEVDLSIEEKLESIPGIEATAPGVFLIARGKGINVDLGSHFTGLESGSINLIGIDPIKEKMLKGGTTEIVEGKMFEKGKKNVAVAGSVFADTTDKGVGDILTVIVDEEEYDFEIIGIFETGTLLQDTYVAIPLEQAQEMRGFDKNTVSIITAKPEKAEMVDEIGRKIKLLIDDVDPSYVKQFLEQINQFTSQINFMTWVIAGIAALVGGIGIANTMLMSVIEQTKEIGVLKSVGWYSRDVLKIILIESLLISIIGAAVGIALASSFIMLITSSGSSSFITPVITSRLLINAILFALVLGIIAGIYPAVRASRMSPLQAFGEE